MADEDIHAATAAQVFGVPLDEVTPEMRRRAKVVNFGVLYGMSEFGLSQREGISREEAAEFIKTYFAKYPGIREYSEETVQRTREQGYVETLLGRRRYIPEIHSRQRRRAPGGRAGGDQHAGPGHGGRHHQDRHDPHRRRDAGAPADEPHDPPGARRARSSSARRRSWTRCESWRGTSCRARWR